MEHDDVVLPNGREFGELSRQHAEKKKKMGLKYLATKLFSL